MKWILSCFVMALSGISFAGGFTNVINTEDPNFIPQAHETNTFFATYYVGENYLPALTSQESEDSKTNRECLPAKDFPEGNWGERECGVQMSLRVAKSVFTNGEPIDTTVLVRNVTNEFFFFMPGNPVKPGLPVSYIVFDELGQSVVSKPDYHGLVLGGHPAVIAPGAQRKYLECVNDSYDLTNGNYLLQAMIYLPEGKPLNENTIIKSAKVPIEIK